MLKTKMVERTINEEWKCENGKYKCPHCEKEYVKNGISTHIWRTHDKNGKKHNPNIGYVDKNRIVWNKGKNKTTDSRVLKMSKTINNNYKTGKTIPSMTGKTHTLENKMKISKRMSQNNNGGRCKWFNFMKKSGDVVKVQGTWEYRFAKILEIIDEEWIKVKYEENHLYEWVDLKGKTHNYIPDFYSPKLNKYFEIKGYWWGDDKIKMECVIKQNKNRIFDIIRKKHLEEYEFFFNVSTTKNELNNKQI